MKKTLLLVASAAMLAMPLAGPAAADDGGICETGVIVHEGPSYSLDPNHPYVETGTYEPYTTCLDEPIIIIDWPDPICLQKPPICV